MCSQYMVNIHTFVKPDTCSGAMQHERYGTADARQRFSKSETPVCYISYMSRFVTQPLVDACYSPVPLVVYAYITSSSRQNHARDWAGVWDEGLC
jgi:hypothetical protein